MPKRWWADRRGDKPVRSADTSLRVLPWWWAVVIVAAVVAGGVVAMLLLGVWSVPSIPTEADKLRLDRIKTALTVAAGLAAGATLLMTLRRQILSERTQRFAESEALEQRSTALYVAAADQLGSDKAAVRLAGLYALERLGQDNVKLRQTVVDVWCAYLRMPYTLPVEVLRGNAAGSPAQPDAEGELPDAAAEAERHQELQVRMTAQRLLAAHLDPMLGDAYWIDAKGAWMVLDLVGAVLVDFSLAACEIGRLSVGRAQFHSVTNLSRAQFHGDANLDEAQFHGDANLDEAQFHSVTNLNTAQFHGNAYLYRTQFHANANLRGVQFHREANLRGVQFYGEADLRGVQFYGDANLGAAQFHSITNLDAAQFHSVSSFHVAQFRGDASLHEAKFHDAANLGGVVFHDNVDLHEAQFYSTFYASGANFHGDAYLLDAQIHDDAFLSEVNFHSSAYLSGAQFHGDARFDGAQLHGDVELGLAQFNGLVDLTHASATRRTILPNGWILSDDSGVPDRLFPVVVVVKGDE
ncbi:pentapeptide repeat-containing protein [Dactylosporangium sp. CA-139066]|uniref:pentapeptide repeat-containing protein n=1 Tax=Dactylosporangium sp. CA-139066 TaxID=3239930 RepID=UPI003D94918B